MMGITQKDPGQGKGERGFLVEALCGRFGRNSEGDAL